MILKKKTFGNRKTWGIKNTEKKSNYSEIADDTPLNANVENLLLMIA